jgi:hypothetical protein
MKRPKDMTLDELEALPIHDGPRGRLVDGMWIPVFDVPTDGPDDVVMFKGSDGRCWGLAQIDGAWVRLAHGWFR